MLGSELGKCCTFSLHRKVCTHACCKFTSPRGAQTEGFRYSIDWSFATSGVTVVAFSIA